jgi:hypothetical protein
MRRELQDIKTFGSRVLPQSNPSMLQKPVVKLEKTTNMQYA